MLQGSLALVWNAFVALWTVGALAGGGLLFDTFSLPFWFAGWQIGKDALLPSLLQQKLEIGPQVNPESQTLDVEQPVAAAAEAGDQPSGERRLHSRGQHAA